MSEKCKHHKPYVVSGDSCLACEREIAALQQRLEDIVSGALHSTSLDLYTPKWIMKQKRCQRYLDSAIPRVFDMISERLKVSETHVAIMLSESETWTAAATWLHEQGV